MKRTVLMALSICSLIVLLSLSVFAASASASSSSASASISTSYNADLEANAHIHSLIESVGDTHTGIRSASAYVSASQLTRPATQSAASAFEGNEMKAFDSWAA